MKPSDLEEIRHAMNRLRAKASEGPMILTRTVMNETAIVMDAIYRAERTAAPASAAEPVKEEAREIIAELVRLADMGYEDSLKEPEENGNFATYERAKRYLGLTIDKR